MKFFNMDGETPSRKRVPRHIYLPYEEDKWLKNQAEEECTSSSSLIRKSLKLYRERISKYES